MSSNTVELIGHYGGDVTHALSAWTSTGRELTPEREARIDKLLNMLAQADPPHTSPFEKSFLHFNVRCDTASHIHLLKHRIAVSINGESARYKELLEPTYYVPDDWPEDIKDKLDEVATITDECYHLVLAHLEPTLGRKRAKESARYFLTYANQLTLDVSFNFLSFMHFYKLRADDGAQLEIHDIANKMMVLVADTGDFPLSLAAWGCSTS